MADEKPVVVKAEMREEPPVVARLVVEIRSDGSRTIARGAIQDAALGQEIGIQAEGTSPMALALSLVKAMVKAPFLGSAFGGALKALTGQKRKR